MDLGNIVLGKDEINVGGVNIPILKGDKGENGDTGATGENGYTPVKGVDYWTAEDKQEIIQDVKEEINLDNINQNIATLQTNKADKTELPTKTSELTNDSGFIDNTDFDALELRVDTAETDIETLQGQVETLETQVADLEEQVSELENNQLTGTATGQSIYIEDSTNAKVRDIGLSGNSEQESTTGKQLFNEVQLLEATDWQVNNGVYSGTIDNWFSKFKSGFTGLSFETNTQYTISLKGYTTGGTPRIKIVYTDNTSSTLAISASSMTDYSITSTSGKTISSVQADFGSGSAQTLSLSEVQIEKGTSKTSWEKYTGGQASPNPSYPQEIHSTGDSGNVNEKVQNANIWDEEWEVGGINSSNGENFNNATAIRSKNYIPTKPQTVYYFKNGTDRAWFYAYDKDKKFIGYAFGNSSSVSNEIKTTIANCYYLKFQCRREYGTTYNNDICINVSNDNINGTYIPHAEQNISFPLAQGQKLMQGDYLADDGVHHVRGETTLNGTEEGWVLRNTNETSNISTFYIPVNNLIDYKIDNSQDYANCNRFIVFDKKSTASEMFDLGEGIAFMYQVGLINRYLYLNIKSITTLEGFLSWLSSNPVKVQYELEEEVIDPYTEEQQAVWEQIKALRTYKPVTHISSTDEVPATVNVTYVKDLETVINNLGGA